MTKIKNITFSIKAPGIRFTITKPKKTAKYFIKRIFRYIKFRRLKRVNRKSKIVAMYLAKAKADLLKQIDFDILGQDKRFKELL
jgi:hypothetical protein